MKLRNLLMWLLVAVASVSMTSCDPVPYDSDYLVGTWYYMGRSDGFDYDSDYNEIFLAPDGTGTYSCYSDNGYGPWSTYSIYWWTQGDYLTIQVLGWDQWTYTYDASPRWLYLYPTNGGPYLIYSSNY